MSGRLYAYHNLTRDLRTFSSCAFLKRANAVDHFSEDLETRTTYYKSFNTAYPAENSGSTMAPRKLQILSDVHLEFYTNGRPLPIIERHGHDIALLGDIGKPFAPSYHTFLTQMSQQFDNVFVLLGNHEYYNVNWTPVEVFTAKAREVCATFDNVHLLERETFDITEKTRILGCTLWSSIDCTAAMGLNDFRMISTNKGKLTLAEYFMWHSRDVTWLESQLAQCITDGKKAMVLTHHGPCKAMSGRFLGSQLNPAFVTDLERLFRPPVVAFASGHVHSNVDVTVNGIRSVSNALGYPGEVTGYQEGVVVDIP